MMTTGNFFNRLQQTYMRRVWSEDLRALPPSRRWLVRNIRLIHNLVTEAVDGQLTLRAMSLVYTTLLALVPLLAISFSVLKAFGVHNQLEPVLLIFLAPRGGGGGGRGGRGGGGGGGGGGGVRGGGGGGRGGERGEGGEKEDDILLVWF